MTVFPETRRLHYICLRFFLYQIYIFALLTLFRTILYKDKFEDTKGVFRNCILQKNRQCNGKKGQEDKQWLTKHYKKLSTEQFDLY
jgi:hypothetical protein